MAKKATAPKTALALDVPVSFGQVSIGDETASVGISVERARLSLPRADEMLCGRRLVGKIEARDSQPDQGHFQFTDGVLAAVSGVFDVNSLSVSTKAIGCRLSFCLPDIDVGQLAKFAKRGGKLEISEVLGEAEANGAAE